MKFYFSCILVIQHFKKSSAQIKLQLLKRLFLKKDYFHLFLVLQLTHEFLGDFGYIENKGLEKLVFNCK